MPDPYDLSDTALADLPEAEIRRLKALRLLHELRDTFGMDDLAREFLNTYVSRFQTLPRHDDSLVTERFIYRQRRPRVTG